MYNIIIFRTRFIKKIFYILIYNNFQLYLSVSKNNDKTLLQVYLGAVNIMINEVELNKN